MKHRNPNQGLFQGYWFDATGNKTKHRVARNEYPEAYRLWRKHTDIRLGIMPIGIRAKYEDRP